MGIAASSDPEGKITGSENEKEIKKHSVEFGCLVVCATLWRRLASTARLDWLSMIMPSVFTKTFGRTLMVTKVIVFTNVSTFILKNLMYAAPEIAFIAGLVVATYHYFDQRKQGKSRVDALKIALTYFLKTAIKFFIVYMGWVCAIAFVTAMGWFATPMVLTAVIVAASCVGAAMLLSILKCINRKFGGSKKIENFLDIFMLSCVFAALAAIAYFASPVLAGLLVVGGITALSLFVATLITEVLPDPNKDINKAWKMLARAYSEGVVWALIEHIGLNVIIGGVIGGVVDVMVVSFSVCLAIFIGGQVDEQVRHTSAHWDVKLSTDTKKFIKSQLKRIQTYKILTEWSEINVSINSIHNALPDDGSRHLFDRYIKHKLGYKILAILENATTMHEVSMIPKECFAYLEFKRAISWLPFSISFGSKTFKMMNEVMLARARYIQAEEGPQKEKALTDWEKLTQTVHTRLDKMNRDTFAKLRYQYKVDLDKSDRYLNNSPTLFAKRPIKAANDNSVSEHRMVSKV